MLKSFSHLASLTNFSVNLYDNNIKYKGAKKLLRPLARHTHLKQLTIDLRDNKITAAGAKVLLLSLTRLTRLAHLQIYLGSDFTAQNTN